MGDERLRHIMIMIIKKALMRSAAVGSSFSLVLILLTIVLAGCGTIGPPKTKIEVATDIIPLADFCRNVGGDLVEVEAMVPPGSNPHSYELTTGQMKFLSRADVLVTNGLGLVPWANDIFYNLNNSGLRQVVAGEAIPREELIPATGGHDHGHGNEDAHEIYDPHVWLDPNLAMDVVEAIRDALGQIDPIHEPDYRKNAKEYIEQIKALDNHAEQETAGFTNRKFVSFHSSWTYFARRYGLEQVAVIEELPGKEPSAGWIADIVDTIKAQGITAIFTESQFSPRAAETVAEEVGPGVKLDILDPLGDPADPETDTYLKMMEHDLKVMAEALK